MTGSTALGGNPRLKIMTIKTIDNTNIKYGVIKYGSKLINGKPNTNVKTTVNNKIFIKICFILKIWITRNILTCITLVA